jgi:hypothetical protein
MLTFRVVADEGAVVVGAPDATTPVDGGAVEGTNTTDAGGATIDGADEASESAGATRFDKIGCAGVDSERVILTRPHTDSATTALIAAAADARIATARVVRRRESRDTSARIAGSPGRKVSARLK